MASPQLRAGHAAGAGSPDPFSLYQESPIPCPRLRDTREPHVHLVLLWLKSRTSLESSWLPGRELKAADAAKRRAKPFGRTRAPILAGAPSPGEFHSTQPHSTHGHTELPGQPHMELEERAEGTQTSKIPQARWTQTPHTPPTTNTPPSRGGDTYPLQSGHRTHSPSPPFTFLTLLSLPPTPPHLVDLLQPPVLRRPPQPPAARPARSRHLTEPPRARRRLK